MKKQEYAIPKELNAEDIKQIRKKLNLTQEEFANLVHASKKTIERWETSDKPITGPITTLVKILNTYPQVCGELTIKEKMGTMRIWYMYENELCTIIDVDERERQVWIQNYTNDYMFQAFGKEKNPSFEQYEEFLESRCFPRTRDKMKMMLKELDIPFYEPIMIIEKTKGRMAEDNFWLRIER